MVKIDFVNSQQPAINDTNLNQMQLNIENAINAQVAGDTLPVGSIMPFGSDTVPENWLLCDGQAVSRTTYDLLFSIIGTTYGVGDGSTTFNLPNLKGKVAVGKDSTQTEFDTLGETGGEKTHTLTIEEMPSHNHGFNLNGDVYSEVSQLQLDNWHWRDTYQVTNSLINQAGGNQPHNILQPYQVTNYIIKAKQSAGVVATVVDNLNSTSTTDALSANQGRILKSSAIYCKLGNEIITDTTDYTDIADWVEINTVGDSFEVSNGQIKVLNNVSKVKVIVKLHGYKSGNTLLYAFIRKNNTSDASSWIVEDISGYKSAYSQSILDVQANDLITVATYGDAISLQGTSTTIIVEKIA